MMTMQMDKPIILYGAGQIGKKALDFYGTKNVRFFADKYKAGLDYYGIPILSVVDLKKMQDQYEIIIAALPKFQDEIKAQLAAAGILRTNLFDPNDAYGMFPSNPRLEKFKNIHAGKRCFLIGNGPSLSAEDLDKIVQRGDISFAANKIYRVFGQTDWRPDYYFAVDRPFITQNWEDMIAAIKANIFLANASECLTSDIMSKIIHNENVYLYQSRDLKYDQDNKVFLPVYDHFNETYPSISKDAAKFVYEGFTVTYVMMQWAAYMGFAELFLLGVDYNQKQTCNYFEQVSIPREFPPEERTDHFCDNYFKEGELVSISDLHSVGLAYEKAEQYSRENGFRIYNATRGGNLEIFERVDFDELMSGK